jgi:two-component system, OmpR family, alkaline phosphatase synthesis response regulator PhoP
MADNINKKVLIVEDDKDFRFILQINFSKEGFSVVTAENGEEGLSLVEKEKPDLIILDILMPTMDGIEMAKQVKQKGINIPIVFLTNMSDIDHISQAQEIVLSDYIIKSDVSVDKIVEAAKTKLGIK